jgi:molybdate transport system substrate-binding protein
MQRVCLLFLSFALVAAHGCGSAGPEPARMFAAVSTREALEELAANYEQARGVRVVLSFGPSSELARQIEQGAPADLFLSADEAWVEFLAGKGLIAQQTLLLTNQLVVVVPAATKLELKTLHDLVDPRVHRLALAGPAVPAGRYARQAFRKAGLWEKVEERILSGGDVRAALTYVARGEAEAGVVYLTDTNGMASVREAFRVPPDLHAPIRYPLALLRQGETDGAVAGFYDYLRSPRAQAVFARLGFGFVANTKNLDP